MRRAEIDHREVVLLHDRTRACAVEQQRGVDEVQELPAGELSLIHGGGREDDVAGLRSADRVAAERQRRAQEIDSNLDALLGPLAVELILDHPEHAPVELVLFVLDRAAGDLHDLELHLARGAADREDEIARRGDLLFGDPGRALDHESVSTSPDMIAQ